MVSSVNRTFSPTYLLSIVTYRLETKPVVRHFSNLLYDIRPSGELLFTGIMDGNIHDVIAMLDAGEVDVNAQNSNG